MEEYKLKLNVGEFTLTIDKEKAYYNNEGVSQFINLYIDDKEIFTYRFGRYDILEKINDNIDATIFNDIINGSPTLIINKKREDIQVSIDGFEFDTINGEDYNTFLYWFTNGLKTVDMRRKEKIEQLKKNIKNN